MKFFRSFLFLLSIIYFLLLTAYSLFSYTLTAPNLVLSSWPVYWNFQTFMWETFFNNRQLLTYSYLILIFLLFIIYFLILKNLKKQKIKIKTFALFSSFFILSFPLLFSNNALSYDVFNYIFNAKEVILYKANPHVQIPLDFPQDNWLRFMHNTHTVAPYGYAWTALSLIPYSLGMGKFLPTWVLFRLFSLFSIILLFFSLKFLARKLDLKLEIYHYALLFLNPLFLIEIISNIHNDLWMMVPAITSLALVSKLQIPNSKSQINFKIIITKILLSLLLLIFSISIKLSTLVLLPIWLVLVFSNLKISNWKLFGIWDLLLGILKKNLILLSSVALFIPLLTERSKQFLPWYLLWSLVWLPIIYAQSCHPETKHSEVIGSGWRISRVWVNLLLIFSFTAMLRYVPYLWFGSYEDNVELWQKLITWSALPIALIGLFISKNYKFFYKKG